MVTETVTESRSGYGHKMLNQYELVRVLGTGQHGEVCYARNALTGVGVVRLRLPCSICHSLTRVCSVTRLSKR